MFSVWGLQGVNTTSVLVKGIDKRRSGTALWVALTTLVVHVKQPSTSENKLKIRDCSRRYSYLYGTSRTGRWETLDTRYADRGLNHSAGLQPITNNSLLNMFMYSFLKNQRLTFNMAATKFVTYWCSCRSLCTNRGCGGTTKWRPVIFGATRCGCFDCACCSSLYRLFARSLVSNRYAGISTTYMLCSCQCSASFLVFSVWSQIRSIWLLLIEWYNCLCCLTPKSGVCWCC